VKPPQAWKLGVSLKDSRFRRQASSLGSFIPEYRDSGKSESSLKVMSLYQKSLDEWGEVGNVEKVKHSIVFVKGLPTAHPNEVIHFESGSSGIVFSLSPEYVEVLSLSKDQVAVGEKAARTGEYLNIPVGEVLLGKTISPLIAFDEKLSDLSGQFERREIDIKPLGIKERANIDKPMETGVTVVDLIVPIGKGQRELVVGDRKTNKTQFVQQAILTQARMGAVCIYAGIGKKISDIRSIEKYFVEKGIVNSTIIVFSSASDASGLIYLTPFAAMTIAEYFRDRGKEVLLILDDLTAHAKYYREISLLADRFPGRNSYPGDIFYLHSRLLERAGNFSLITTQKNGQISRKTASITCLPVAELVMGDLSGYIQTNLMAMTDGHIFFDKDYFDQGRRPSVNPFLSVTRVGRQAHSPLLRDLSRELTSFLVKYEELKQFLHFGAELSEDTKKSLILGDRVITFFEQSSYEVVPININIFLVACIWAGIWRNLEIMDFKKRIEKVRLAYVGNNDFRQKVDSLIASYQDLKQLVGVVKENETLVLNIT